MGQEKPKTKMVSARIDEDLFAELSIVTRLYGVDMTTMITDSLEAVARYVAEGGKYKRPLRVSFDETQELSMAAEGPSAYGASAVEKETPSGGGGRRSSRSGDSTGGASTRAPRGSSKKKPGEGH